MGEAGDKQSWQLISSQAGLSRIQASSTGCQNMLYAVELEVLTQIKQPSVRCEPVWPRIGIVGIDRFDEQRPENDLRQQGWLYTSHICEAATSRRAGMRGKRAGGQASQHWTVLVTGPTLRKAQPHTPQARTHTRTDATHKKLTICQHL